MRKLHPGRLIWFFSVLLFATPMLLPLSARNHSKAQASDEEQPESLEISNIINRVIATEHEYDLNLMEYSPRVETYVQYLAPDAELGDKVKDDALFLGRVKFGT